MTLCCLCSKPVYCVWETVSICDPGCPPMYDPVCVVLHVFSPRTLKVEADWSLIDQHSRFQASKTLSQTKNKQQIYTFIPTLPPYPWSTTWDYRWVPQCLTEIRFLFPNCLFYIVNKKFSVRGIEYCKPSTWDVEAKGFLTAYQIEDQSGVYLNNSSNKHFYVLG